MANLFNKTRAMERKRFQANSLQMDHSRELKSFENYFKRGKGQIEVNPIQMNEGDESGIFEVSLTSKTSDKPITATIEADFHKGQVVNNPLETICQNNDFFEDVTNDVFHHSRQNIPTPEKSPLYKQNLEERDYMKMTAIADKINQTIEKSLYQEIKVDKDFAQEKEEPKKGKKRYVSKNLSFGM